MPLLGEILLQRKVLTPEQLNKALELQRDKRGLLGRFLFGLKMVKEEELYSALSFQLGIPYLRLGNIQIEPSVLEKFPAKFACHYKVMPIKFEDGNLTIAMENPLDIFTIDEIRLFLGYEIKIILAGEEDIYNSIKRHYGIGADTIEKIVDTSEKKRDALPLINTQIIDTFSNEANIIKFVNQLLSQAIEDNATDIHLEPYEDEFKVRYRIDGILYDVPVPQDIRYFKTSVVSRIKIMANLDIAEHRLPQDGRIKIKLLEKEMDLRISILPTQFGESVDIRILAGSMLYSLERLGLLPADLDILERLIRKPHGIIFVTGPTGSGKTTTLYVCLSKINTKDKKIITIEDPIEYQLKGITQIQVHPRIGLDFTTGLRSMLRHDPDIMMVGEVRDFETAEITIRVSLTGHLVFSTLHTNDAAGGIARLLDMGIEPYLIASSVECFIAQRLVRLVCPLCKVEKIVDKKILIEFGVEDNINNLSIYEGRGCDLCKFSGYRGRTAIYEFLVMNEQIRELILSHASIAQIKRKAMESGMHTLRMDGWEKIQMGLTTIEEVMRVTEEV